MIIPVLPKPLNKVNWNDSTSRAFTIHKILDRFVGWTNHEENVWILGQCRTFGSVDTLVNRSHWTIENEFHGGRKCPHFYSTGRETARLTSVFSKDWTSRWTRTGRCTISANGNRNWIRRTTRIRITTTWRFWWRGRTSARERTRRVVLWEWLT